MNGKVEYYHNSAWVDISDYVDTIADVPFLARNRDWTLTTNSMTITIASTIKDLLNNQAFEFGYDEKIKISIDLTTVYVGYIDKSIYNYGPMTFSLTMKTNIDKLKDYIVDYDTLHTAFATGTNWWEWAATENKGIGPIVGLTWAMQKMFGAAGLTLDTSGIIDTPIITFVGSPTFRDCTITFKDLFFYEDILWCAGQSVCCGHQTIDNQIYDYTSKKQTCFDIISEILTSLKLQLLQTDVDNYKLVYSTEIYTITDNNKFEYQKEKVRSDNSNYANAFSWRYFFNDPKTYQSNLVITDETSRTYGKGNLIPSIQNFLIYLSDAKLNVNKYADAYNMRGCNANLSLIHIENDNTADPNINSIAMRIRDKALDYTTEEITTDFQPTQKAVVGHDIDVIWTNSKIVQEI